MPSSSYLLIRAREPPPRRALFMYVQMQAGACVDKLSAALSSSVRSPLSKASEHRAAKPQRCLFCAGPSMTKRRRRSLIPRSDALAGTRFRELAACKTLAMPAKQCKAAAAS